MGSEMCIRDRQCSARRSCARVARAAEESGDAGAGRQKGVEGGMTQGVSFQTRARTIDHLGRGQIADAPTAISELWKNAYDAYARNVALHIFDGQPSLAAIFDDGVGMTRQDVLERWLVIGTESKIEDFGVPPADTFGLPLRTRQGEKGIGRLSVAFLAPGTILVCLLYTSTSPRDS